jgi:hypothetical protein
MGFTLMAGNVITKDELKERTKKVCAPMCEAGDEFAGYHVGKTHQESTHQGGNVGGGELPACLAHSKASFTAKLSIVIEEADESAFWLEFIIDEKLMKRELVEPLFNEANELTSIFISSRKTIQTGK